ncbi:MAG: metal ABC transporter substrate-binding protein [Candidatus Zixiibacteriota bacterium]
MKKTGIICFVLLLASVASARIRIVASTTDLAYLAEQIGGDLVKTESLTRPEADLHFVDVRPSYMVRVGRADIVLRVGLELDLWMGRIIDGSRNNELRNIDCSRYVKPLEVPNQQADARFGDIHRFGNPHYWLSPENLQPMTDAITEALVNSDPENADRYRDGQQRLLSDISAQLKMIKAKVDSLRGHQIIYYHNSWPYFNAYTGQEAAGFVEPFPGVPPSPSHIKKLMGLIRDRDIRIIAVEPYHDRRVPDRIASETDCRVVVLYPSIGGRQEGESYIEWFEGNVDALLEVFR